MVKLHPKRTKRELRQLTRLTRPPRLEGAVKNAGSKPVKKARKKTMSVSVQAKPQGPNARQRKDLQLPSRRH